MPMPSHHRRRRGPHFRGLVCLCRHRDGARRCAVLSRALADLPRRARLGRDGGTHLGADRHGRGRREPGASHGGDLRHLDSGADGASRPSRASLAARRHAPGQVIGALEWYPPGRIVGWAALIAGLLAGLLVLILGYDQESYREVDPRDPQSQRPEGARSRRNAVHRGEHCQPLGHDRPCAARRLRHHLAHHHPFQSLDGRADRRCLWARAEALAQSAYDRASNALLLVFAGALAASFFLGYPDCSRPGSPARALRLRVAGACGDPRL